MRGSPAYTLGWSLFAALLFVFGLNKASTAAHKASIGIFAVSILKLFPHDVWSLGQLYRMAAFMVTAAGAMRIKRPPCAVTYKPHSGFTRPWLGIFSLLKLPAPLRPGRAT